MEEQVQKQPFISKARAEKLVNTITDHINSLFAEAGASIRRDIKSIKVDMKKERVEIEFKKKVQATGKFKVIKEV